MAVEIYREPELESMITNVGEVEEWKKMIEELGMSGQKTLVETDKKPSVYIHMNNSLVNTLRALCPCEVEYTKYKQSAIPLEVLREIALCVHEGYFTKIMIWYDDISPDPVVVGRIGDTYDAVLHLIARFGDEILPLSELKIKAKNRLMESVKQQYKDMASTLEKAVNDHLNGQWTNLSINLR